PIILPDEIYDDMIDFAQLSNQSTVDIISALLNCAFGSRKKKLNIPDIEVAVVREQTKPQIVLTVPDELINFVDGLYRNWSLATAPELITLVLPPDKDIANLFTNTLIGNYGTFSMRRRAEILVSKLSDTELLAFLDAKDTQDWSDIKDRPWVDV